MCFEYNGIKSIVWNFDLYHPCKRSEIFHCHNYSAFKMPKRPLRLLNV